MAADGRLARDDRLDVVVGKDRIDVEAAAEAIGLAAVEVRDLGQVEDGGQLRQVLDRMQRRRAVQAVARLALRRAGLGERRSSDRGRRAGRIDLDAVAAGFGQRLGGAWSASRDWASAEPCASRDRRAAPGRW